MPLPQFFYGSPVSQTGSLWALGSKAEGSDHGEQACGLEAPGLCGKRERGPSTLSERASLSEAGKERPCSLLSLRHPDTQDRAPASQREGRPGWLAGDVASLFVLCTMPQKKRFAAT